MNMDMGSNMNMNRNIDMGMMNMMINNQPFQKEDESNKITLIFRYKDKSYTQYCNLIDKFELVKKKITKKLKLDGNEKFIFNAKQVAPNLTVAEAGMTNNSNIFIISTEGVKGVKGKENSIDSDSHSSDSSIEDKVKKEINLNNKKINITFKTTLGARLFFLFDENISISMAIKTFLERIKKPELIHSDNICFVHNAQKIDTRDNRCLKDIFIGNMNPVIIVSDITNMIGA